MKDNSHKINIINTHTCNIILNFRDYVFQERQ